MRVLFSLCLLAGPAFAEAPEITTVKLTGDMFDVTLLHPDTGWDHYADGWEILAMDGTSLGYRKLHHPHKNKQPFTRSLGGVSLPAGTKRVQVRSHCNVTGWSDPITVTVEN